MAKFRRGLRAGQDLGCDPGVRDLAVRHAARAAVGGLGRGADLHQAQGIPVVLQRVGVDAGRHLGRPLGLRLRLHPRGRGEAVVPGLVAVFEIEPGHAREMRGGQFAQLRRVVVIGMRRHVHPGVRADEVGEIQHGFERRAVGARPGSRRGGRTLCPGRQGRRIGLAPIHESERAEALDVLDEIRAPRLARREGLEGNVGAGRGSAGRSAAREHRQVVGAGAARQVDADVADVVLRIRRGDGQVEVVGGVLQVQDVTSGRGPARDLGGAGIDDGAGAVVAHRVASRGQRVVAAEQRGHGTVLVNAVARIGQAAHPTVRVEIQCGLFLRIPGAGARGEGGAVLVGRGGALREPIARALHDVDRRRFRRIVGEQAQVHRRSGTRRRLRAAGSLEARGPRGRRDRQGRGGVRRRGVRGRHSDGIAGAGAGCSNAAVARGGARGARVSAAEARGAVCGRRPFIGSAAATTGQKAADGERQRGGAHRVKKIQCHFGYRSRDQPQQILVNGEPR